MRAWRNYPYSIESFVFGIDLSLDAASLQKNDVLGLHVLPVAEVVEEVAAQEEVVLFHTLEDFTGLVENTLFVGLDHLICVHERREGEFKCERSAERKMTNRTK